MCAKNYLPSKRDLTNLVLHFESAEMAETFPALYQLLSHAKRDGRFRAGARLSLFCEDGRLKASIWDPDTSSVWFATLDSFQGALEAIEGMITDGRGEWRERKETGSRR